MFLELFRFEFLGHRKFYVGSTLQSFAIRATFFGQGIGSSAGLDKLSLASFFEVHFDVLFSGTRYFGDEGINGVQGGTTRTVDVKNCLADRMDFWVKLCHRCRRKQGKTKARVFYGSVWIWMKFCGSRGP